MMTVTEKAAKKAITLAERDGKKPRLRVGVRGGGCSGVSYFYEFDDEERDGDEVWEVAGLTIVCDPKSKTFLEGAVLDYDTNLLKGGFKWSNPQAKRSCSCGESFTI